MDGMTADVAELTRRLSGNGTDGKITETERVATPLDNTPPHVHQLHAARFVFHKVWCKQYGDAVQQGLLPLEEGRLRYKLAMQNYDELIKSSANGSVTEADQADMDKGFPL